MAKRIYKVPETRLPFVNTEVTEIEFEGKPHLVSAVWGDRHAGGRIYFWDPHSGKHAMRMLPKGSPGAYMIRTGPDGKLYLGDGKGDLHRYDPKADAMETLVSGKLKSITWGGCVTDRYVVWTADPGEAVVYEWREGKVVKVIAPVDSSTPHAHYGHNVIAAPGGKQVLLMMDTPQARICVLDLETMEVESRTPESIVGENSILNACFVDERTLFLLTSTRVQVMSWPDLKVIKDVGLPKGTTSTYSRGARVGDHFYAIVNSPGRDLWRIGLTDWKWEKLAENWMGEDTGFIGSFLGKYAAGISINGLAHTYDIASGKTMVMDVENIGVMEAHGMGVGPEMNVIVGSPFINARFWTINLETGEGKDQGRGMPAGGQINQVLWDGGRHKALMSSYTEASVMEYDPREKSEWPKNPRVIASARPEGQMRPWETVFDRRYVWMATGAVYGSLGGALSRIDPETNTIKVWRHLVKDQTINALALDVKRRRLFFSSHIYADGESCPPTQTSAEIGAFDIDGMKVIRQQKFHEGVPKVGVVCVLPDGKVLVHEKDDFYSWSAETGELATLGTLSGMRSVVVGDDGTMWASFGDAVGRLDVKGGKIAFVKLIDGRARQMALGAATLYYSIGVEIHAIDLADLRVLENMSP